MAPPDDPGSLRALSIGTLYAIAAVFGMVGGCGAGLHYLTHNRHPTVPFILAYVLIGAIAGVTFLSVVSVYGLIEVETIHELILYSIIAGSVVSFGLFTANATVKFIFRRLGVEVQITTRKAKEERRCQFEDSPACPLNKENPDDG